MRNSQRAALLVALLGGACSGNDRAATMLSATGGSASKLRPSPTGLGVGGDAAAGRADQPAPDEVGGERSDAGQGSGGQQVGGQGVSGEASAGAGMPWMEPEHEPICPTRPTLTDAVKLAISSSDADQFGGVSADELVIAWTVVAAGQVTLHYARRTELDAEFGSEQTLEIAAAPDSVSLSFDGLRLVYVNADRKGFTQLVRAEVGEPFEQVDARDFVPIHESTQLFAADEFVGDPVLGPDNLSFVYSRYGADRKATLLLTQRFSPYAPWPEGAPLPVAEEFEATLTERQRPTGLSLDLEALFLWDSAASAERVATLSHETYRYESSYALGDARGAAPNAGCKRVYYGAAGDLWSAALGVKP